jgi:hypothetical protein
MTLPVFELREQILTRARKVLRLDGADTTLTYLPRLAVVGDYSVMISSNEIIISRPKSDGGRGIVFYENPNVQQDPDLVEWQRILDTFRKRLILDELADV